MTKQYMIAEIDENIKCKLFVYQFSSVSFPSSLNLTAQVMQKPNLTGRSHPNKIWGIHINKQEIYPNKEDPQGQIQWVCKI